MSIIACHLRTSVQVGRAAADRGEAVVTYGYTYTAGVACPAFHQAGGALQRGDGIVLINWALLPGTCTAEQGTGHVLSLSSVFECDSAVRQFRLTKPGEPDEEVRQDSQWPPLEPIRGFFRTATLLWSVFLIVFLLLGSIYSSLRRQFGEEEKRCPHPPWLPSLSARLPLLVFVYGAL